jgi:hypothetical protein
MTSQLLDHRNVGSGIKPVTNKAAAHFVKTKIQHSGQLAPGFKTTLTASKGHFLTGAPDWFTRTIELSLKGASEVRKAFFATSSKFRARGG